MRPGIWTLGGLLSWGALAGCSPPPRGPYFGDERYLVVGVDPFEEADVLAERLRDAGYGVVPRLRGRHFAALGYADGAGRPQGVRVVTARGIELALDPVEGDVFHRAVRYRLLQPPLIEDHDADGDGFEEIFVEHLLGLQPERCLLVFRVRDAGFVDPVAGEIALAGTPRRDEALWLEPYYCEPEHDAGQAEPPPAGDAGQPTAPPPPPTPPPAQEHASPPGS